MAQSLLRNRYYYSSAPGGYGHLTKAGYRRLYDAGQKRLRFEHDLVWEARNGEIPEGKEIHHKDGDKLNNHINNLQLVDDLTQKRIHSGCKLIDGIWYKPCKKCNVYNSVDKYYQVKRSGGQNIYVFSICKPCAISMAVKFKQNERFTGKKAEKIS